MQPFQAYLVSTIAMVIVMVVPNATTMRAVDSAWYTCVRPSITPPKIVFPIVWTLLYISIGIAFAQALMLKNSYEKNVLIGLFVWNLLLNVLWSHVYFGHRDVILALFVLLNLIMATMFLLYYVYLRLPPWIFWLLLPYLAWLYFACLLNFLSTIKTC